MILSRIGENNYLVKIPNVSEYFSIDEDNILDFFKVVFGKLIKKYKIRGDVIINFYLDPMYGIIMDVYNKNLYGYNINTKIIFHLDCNFLIEVDYFNCEKNTHLYYYKNKFYKIYDNDGIYDGEIVYNVAEIIDNGVSLYT